MATRVAILDDYQHVAIDSADWPSLTGVGIQAFHDPLGDEAAVAESLAGFEVVVAMRERTPFPASQLTMLTDLKLLVTTGMRNLAIDMEAARSHGITVCGTAMLGYPAAEHAWALILSLVKQIPRENQAMHEGGWQTGFADGLRDHTLGVLGLGKLGSQVAAVGNTFGMQVIAWSENLTDDRAAECGVTRVDKETLFTDSDVLSIHLLLSDRTRGLVGAHEFKLMKPTAYLVNTSRGPIVDEAALVEALISQTIAGAGIDVFDVEPLPLENPLRKLDNAVLTGHTAYVMRDNYAVAYGEAVEDIAAWLKREPVRILNGE